MSFIHAFINGRIITPFEDIPKGVVLVEGPKILAVGSVEDISIPPNSQIHDITSYLICPGFIDIHVHGAKGRDFSEAETEAIDQIVDFHLKHGTTSLLATFISLPHQNLLRIVEEFPKACSWAKHSPTVLGIHLEGPFLHPSYRGVHNIHHLSLPSVEKIAKYNERSGNRLKMVTLAPELPKAEEIIQWLANRNILVSLGHSDATYEQVKRAVSLGLHHTTHIFNAMRGFHHREPGALGACLDIEGISTDIIADGRHVHPMSIRLLWQIKGCEKIIIITDASPVCGLHKGRHALWGREVILDENQVVTADTGTLAGSVLTMNHAVRSIRRMITCSFAQAVQMATYNPAALLGIEHQKGQLRKGNDADLVIMDENCSIHMVVVGGTILSL